MQQVPLAIDNHFLAPLPCESDDSYELTNRSAFSADEPSLVEEARQLFHRQGAGSVLSDSELMEQILTALDVIDRLCAQPAKAMFN